MSMEQPIYRITATKPDGTTEEMDVQGAVIIFLPTEKELIENGQEPSDELHLAVGSLAMGTTLNVAHLTNEQVWQKVGEQLRREVGVEFMQSALEAFMKNN